MDATTYEMREELAGLEYKLDHGYGSPEAQRRMLARVIELRGLLAGQLFVTDGVPDARNLEWF